MSRTIVITSGKGGVGKTTATANLGMALAQLGYQVALIDADIGLRNLDLLLGLENRVIYTALEVLSGECRLEQALIRDKRQPGLVLLPAAQNRNKDSIDSDQMQYLVTLMNKQYDYILIDCPPSLGLLTLNALCAVKRLIIPLQTEFYALEGLTQLLKTLDLVQNNFNKDIKLQGILLTMYDSRNKISEMVSNDVKEHFKDKVFKTIIPRNVRVSEAPSFGQPVLMYDINCPGSQAYAALAGEIINQEKDL